MRTLNPEFYLGKKIEFRQEYLYTAGGKNINNAVFGWVIGREDIHMMGVKKEICLYNIKNLLRSISFGYPYKFDSFIDYRPESSLIVLMSPDEFLSCLSSSKGHNENPMHVDKIIRWYKEGNGFSILQLDFDIKTGKILNHEGRHRAYAFKKIGFKLLPVLICHKIVRENGMESFANIAGVNKRMWFNKKRVIPQW